MNMIRIKTSLIDARMEVMMMPTAELAEAIGKQIRDKLKRVKGLHWEWVCTKVVN